MQSGTTFGLGFGLWENFSKGYDLMPGIVDPASLEGAFFKNGYTGTMFSVFPKLGLANVILTNHVHDVRPANTSWIHRFRYCVNMVMLFGELPEDVTSLWKLPVLST
jgi:CubicO group peptidase (beta-lactamase class C family)